jgi:hypothetical protein
MDTPPALPQPREKSSAYARSRCFRWGVWALAAALVLIIWGAIKDSMIADKAKLFTLNGVVLEERSTETGGGTRVRLGTGGSARMQGDRKQTMYLKVRSKEGLVKEFTESEWYQTPKAGWVNQPIRMQYDSLGRIYEIEVAGELIRSAETTVKYRKIDNKKSIQLIVFLIVTGTPMVIIGWLLSLRKPMAPAPPPLPVS